MMIRQAVIILAPALMLSTFAGHADVLRMENNRTVMMESPIEYVHTPARGMHMDRVRSQFGTPKTTYPAVGDPPITRWDYESFHVFFEHQLVLHAVVPNKPLLVDHQDELTPAALPQ